jgi:amidase
MLTVYIQGVLTRTVRDSAAILDVISGGMPGDGCVAPPPARPYIDEVGADPGKLRIGVMTTMPGIETHPDCVEAADQAGKLLESLGHSVEELGPGLVAVEPPNDLDGYLKAIGAIRSVQAWHVDYWSRRTGKPIGPDDVEPYTWALAEAGRSATALDLLRGLEYTNTWVRQVARWWADGYDLLVTPTNTLPPPKLGYFDLSPDKPLELLAKTAALAAFSSFISSTGHPAVSLPLSWNADDLPIGVQLAAAYGREDILFRVASQLEQAQPWAERRPPLSA